MAVATQHSVASALRWGTANLTPGRTAALDASLLLAHVLHCDRVRLLTHPELELSPDALVTYEHLIRRRASGVPVAHLRGHVAWLDLDLAVVPGVLVPRPDTEVLAEQAIARARQMGARRIADVGTGSGALAIALARAVPDAEIDAVDTSDAALEVAAKNVARYDLTGRIALHRGHLIEPLTIPPDLIVANLPYLSAEMMAGLPADVRHEPARALYGGPDGLDLYRDLCLSLAGRAWNIPLLIEIDPSQAATVKVMFKEILPPGETHIVPDLAGQARVAYFCPAVLT